MKPYFTLIAIVSGALLSGCATGGSGLVLDSVGPSASQPAQAAPSSNTGTLLVYSAFRRNADFNSPDPNHPEYSDYEINTADGMLLQKVHNSAGTVAQDAVPVALPPGKYNVKARANGYGIITIPVVVEAQRKTVLHLEGGNTWPAGTAFDQSNAVRLPDGQIVGWKTGSNL